MGGRGEPGRRGVVPTRVGVNRTNRHGRGQNDGRPHARGGEPAWVRARAGMSHYVTDYTVTDRVAPGRPSSRYQKFQSVPFVAIALRL